MSQGIEAECGPNFDVRAPSRLHFTLLIELLPRLRPSAHAR